MPSRTETLVRQVNKPKEATPTQVVSLDITSPLQVSSLASGSRSEIADTRTCYSPSPRCHNGESNAEVPSMVISPTEQSKLIAKASEPGGDFDVWTSELTVSSLTIGDAPATDKARTNTAYCWSDTKIC